MARSAVKFKASLHGFKFDNAKFTKKFNEAAQVAVREAARAWLRAVILEVPVWTGFALGSIKFAHGENGNLGRYLNVSIPISPKSVTPRFYYHFGRRTQKIPERAGTYSKYTFPSSQMRYRFTFRTDVIHFVLNEFYASYSPSSPWRSFEAGKIAFRAKILERAATLPKVSDYVIRIDPASGKKIQIKGSNQNG